MRKSLRVLIVEDSEDDALLLLRALRQGGYDPMYAVVETSAAMRRAVSEKEWDVILCDYKMPQFSGLAAISLLKETGLDIPIIIVSGTIGEDVAAEAMRLGANDYVMKGNLSRLVPALEREMVEAESRRKRRQAEQKLREQYEFTNSLLEAIPSPVFSKDRGGRYTGCNRAFEKFLGLSREEIIGRTFYDMWPKEVADQYFEKDNELFANPGVQTYAWVVFKRDGERRDVIFNKATITDVSGGVIGLIGVISDVTDLRETEEALHQAEADYRGIFENAVEGIYQSTPEGGFISVNPAYARMYGYATPAEMLSSVTDIGRDLYVDAEDRKRFRRILQTNGVVRGFETQHYKKDGSKIWVRVNAIVVKDSTGRILYNGFAEDITDRKISEKEKETLLKQLQQAQKMEAIGTLAGGIAHDFNNILNAILGYTDMALSDCRADDPHRHYLEQVYRAGERARDMVKQILSFSRREEKEKKPVLIAPILKEGIKLLRATLPTTIKIAENIEDTSAMVLADPSQIHQVLMNLCTNAAHAMREEGGTLEIKLVQEAIESDRTSQHPNLTVGDYAKLTVSDTGSGIDASIMDRIFDPFFTTKGPHEGTGLGLSVVYGIIKDHGGDIGISSEVGKGTTATVYFPLIQAEAIIAERVSEAILGGGERILFVDDEAALAELGSMVLESLGYQVTSRTSSIEALEAFRTRPHNFDLVITDMTMPNLRGDDLARELLKIRPDIPVIICSGFSEMMSEDKARNIGIRGFIMKPVSRNHLSIAIRDALKAK